MRRAALGALSAPLLVTVGYLATPLGRPDQEEAHWGLLVCALVGCFIWGNAVSVNLSLAVETPIPWLATFAGATVVGVPVVALLVGAEQLGDWWVLAVVAVAPLQGAFGAALAYLWYIGRLHRGMAWPLLLICAVTGVQLSLDAVLAAGYWPARVPHRR